MDDEKIISLITGRTDDEVKRNVERNKGMVGLTGKLIDEIIKTSETDWMLMTNIISCIATIIAGFHKDDRMMILNILITSEAEGMSDKIVEQIKKFRNTGDTGNKNERQD